MERTTERLARCAYIARTTFPGVLLALGLSSCDRDAPTAAGRPALARDSAWVVDLAGLAVALQGTPCLNAATSSFTASLSRCATFPRSSRRETVLSDMDRRTLRRKKIDVDPDSHRRLLDENLLGHATRLDTGG